MKIQVMITMFALLIAATASAQPSESGSDELDAVSIQYESCNIASIRVAKRRTLKCSSSADANDEAVVEAKKFLVNALCQHPEERKKFIEINVLYPVTDEGREVYSQLTYAMVSDAIVSFDDLEVQDGCADDSKFYVSERFREE